MPKHERADTDLISVSAFFVALPLAAVRNCAIILKTAPAKISDKLGIKGANVEIANILAIEIYYISVRNAACTLGTKKRVFFTPGKRGFSNKTVVFAVKIFNVAI